VPKINVMYPNSLKMSLVDKSSIEIQYVYRRTLVSAVRLMGAVWVERFTHRSARDCRGNSCGLLIPKYF